MKPNRKNRNQEKINTRNVYRKRGFLYGSWVEFNPQMVEDLGEYIFDDTIKPDLKERCINGISETLKILKWKPNYFRIEKEQYTVGKNYDDFCNPMYFIVLKLTVRLIKKSK